MISIVDMMTWSMGAAPHDVLLQRLFGIKIFQKRITITAATATAVEHVV